MVYADYHWIAERAGWGQGELHSIGRGERVAARRTLRLEDLSVC